ncbi:MAG: hypothetical protein ABL995_15105 [Bryobacteraceae bacterium]
MLDFFQALENTGFSTWIRESGSIWAYPIVLTLHTIGLGMLVGFNWAVDLRLLGVGEQIPVLSMDRFFPWMWWGFWINAASGLVLTIADATTKMTSWVFGVKLALIACAIIVLRQIHKQVFVKQSSDGKALAAISLVLWILATTAGRLMAYIGPVSGLVGTSNN